MNKKFVWLVTLLLPAVGAFTEAQEAKKVPRIGILFIGSRNQPHLESFKQVLQERGYTEAKILPLNTATLKADKTNYPNSPLS